MRTVLNAWVIGLSLIVTAAAEPPARGGRVAFDAGEQRERVAARIAAARSATADGIAAARVSGTQAARIERALGKAEAALAGRNLRSADDYARRAERLLAGTAVGR